MQAILEGRPDFAPMTAPPVNHAPDDWVFPDDQQGATDTAKILAAFTLAQGENVGVAFHNRDYDLRQPIPAYSDIAVAFLADPGPKLAMNEADPIGVHTNFAGPMFRATGDVQGAYVGNVTVLGHATGRLWDQTAGVLSAAMFDSCSLYGCNGGLGSDTLAVTTYQVLVTGHWEVHGMRGTPFRWKGAEVFALGCFVNVDSPNDVPGNGRPLWWNDNLEKAHLEGLYLTGRNGWVPMRQSGSADRGLNTVSHSNLEGYKANSPSTVPALQVQGGAIDVDKVNLNYVTGPATGYIAKTGGWLRVGAVGVKLADGALSMPLLAETGGTPAEIIGTPWGYGEGALRTVRLRP